MKKLILLFLLLAWPAFAGSVYVEGHYKNGTYVAPYYRSVPNTIHKNNWIERPLNSHTQRRYKPDRYHTDPTIKDFGNKRGSMLLKRSAM